MIHPFDRYAPFTDVAALKAQSDKPLRKSKRVNLLKSSPEDFKRWAKVKNWTLEPVPWCAEGFYLERENRDEAMGKDLLHVMGHTYMQEAASMLPAALLDPQPGEKVLDMSAAPGSKTTQIASKMRGKGVIIANDVQEKRLWSLVSNLQRCGVVNVRIVKKVGQWFARNTTGRFDRVLCDAPCTAQGTARKDSDALSFGGEENIIKMARLQKELLESAIHAAKIGGRIVYSTCTLTPEENEGTILAMLKTFGDKIEVIDAAAEQGIDLSAAKSDSIIVQKHMGITDTFPAYRLWPQTYDTEGFFAAVIVKKAATRDAEKWNDDAKTTKLEIVQRQRVNSIVERLDDWYGNGFLDENERLFENKENLSVTTEELLDFRIPTTSYVTGLPYGKSTNHGLVRMSHEIVSLRGDRATKQMVTLTEDQFLQALKGVNLHVEAKGVEDGDVLLAVDYPMQDGKPLRIVVGRGLLKEGVILNRMPREIVRMFS
jgi:16S rRNA (cytosine1407-C5)-methyltransferase